MTAFQSSSQGVRPFAAMLPLLALLAWAAPAQAQTNFRMNGSGASEATHVDVSDCFDYTEYAATGALAPLGEVAAVGWQLVSYCDEIAVAGQVTFTDDAGDTLTFLYMRVWEGRSALAGWMVAAAGTGRYLDA